MIILAVCMLMGIAVCEKVDSGLCKLCPVSFLAVCKCLSSLIKFTAMSHVDCGDDGQLVR